MSDLIIFSHFGSFKYSEYVRREFVIHKTKDNRVFINVKIKPDESAFISEFDQIKIVQSKFGQSHSLCVTRIFLKDVDFFIQTIFIIR